MSRIVAIAILTVSLASCAPGCGSAKPPRGVWRVDVAPGKRSGDHRLVIAKDAEDRLKQQIAFIVPGMLPEDVQSKLGTPDIQKLDIAYKTVPWISPPLERNFTYILSAWSVQEIDREIRLRFDEMDQLRFMSLPRDWQDVVSTDWGKGESGDKSMFFRRR